MGVQTILLKLQRKRLGQAGVGHIAAVLVLVVAGAIGLIGYKLYAHPNKTASTTGTAMASTTPTPATAPTITSASDLDTASNVIDQNDPSTTSASDSASLDSQTSALQ